MSVFLTRATSGAWPRAFCPRDCFRLSPASGEHTVSAILDRVVFKRFSFRSALWPRLNIDISHAERRKTARRFGERINPYGIASPDLNRMRHCVQRPSQYLSITKIN